MRLNVNLSPNWVLDYDMKEYRPQETVDFCIIGSGAGGGVLAQRLARYGYSVVILEAGPWHDTEYDMVSDEAGSQRLYWNDLRVTGGDNPLELGANNSGKGVGGSTIHYAAFCPRLHPSDFRTRTLDGVGADWPMEYEELEPYYAQMEREYPNLFVCDGSVLPTQGSSNPALTISALAARTADWLSRAIPRGELRERPGVTAEARR